MLKQQEQHKLSSLKPSGLYKLVSLQHTSFQQSKQRAFVNPLRVFFSHFLSSWENCHVVFFFLLLFLHLTARLLHVLILDLAATTGMKFVWEKFAGRKMSQRSESKLGCSFPFSCLSLSLSYSSHNLSIHLRGERNHEVGCVSSTFLVVLFWRSPKELRGCVLASEFLFFYSVCMKYRDKNISGIHSLWPPTPPSPLPRQALKTSLA